MDFMKAFAASTTLIKSLGESNAFLIWAMGLYLDEPDMDELASECLTDDSDDKKIDFIKLDEDRKTIFFAQGYFSKRKVEAAPSNKAADLNTASAWLLSGDLNQIPDPLRDIIAQCRTSISDGEIEAIELLFVHNLPESVNVTKELQTAAEHLRQHFPESSSITVAGKELGFSAIDGLYSTQESAIKVKVEINCPAEIEFEVTGPTWSAGVASVPALWLHTQFTKHQDDLFSANYRGFLGITKRRKINNAIRASAETQPASFWVYNNGITILTQRFEKKRHETLLSGMSIINGAQTTGSLGSIDLTKHDLKGVNVLCRFIQSSDADTISQIIKYNNTQNEITTWDQYSNDPEQKRIAEEFASFGHHYSLKRGFMASCQDSIGIEQVAQSLLSLQGMYREANQGKNAIFDRRNTYRLCFEHKKARHILFAYALSRAVDERRIELKRRHAAGQLITIEEPQLRLLHRWSSPKGKHMNSRGRSPRTTGRHNARP